MKFALVGKDDEETSSWAWCPVAAEEQALVEAPPPQASEQLLSEGVPAEDRVS